MTLQATTQKPISLGSAQKSDVRTQFAALCYRQDKGRTRILLITSRRSGRWIIPRGWPIDGMTPAECALTEAWEEAGVTGQVHARCLGLFSYRKTLEPEVGLPCVAMVYPVLVSALAEDFPEAGQRKRKWCSPRKASARVAEPELAAIIRDFDPHRLAG